MPLKTKITIFVWCALAGLACGSGATGGGTGGSAASGGARASGAAGTGGSGPSGGAGASGAAGTGGSGASAGAGASGGAGTGGSGASAGVGASGTAGTGGSNSSGPQIVSATADMPTLTTANVVTFTVVATDPDGLADLAGGNVMQPGGGTYGALQADPTAGSFSCALAWNTVNAISPITTEGTKAASRTFEIDIFDRAGNRATTTVTITLHCSGALSTACNGNCVSFYSNEADCGTTCDNHRACTAQETCDKGVCTPIAAAPLQNL